MNGYLQVSLTGLMVSYITKNFQKLLEVITVLLNKIINGEEVPEE
jgi:hypothetical protein